MFKSDRISDNITQVTSTIITGVWLVALFTGQSWWLSFMLFGYIIVVPLTALIFGDEQDIDEWWDSDIDIDNEDEKEQEKPIKKLKNRYVNGEISEDQFDRKLQKLIETENVEDRDFREIKDSIDRELEKEYSK
jgi:uncharacterized membrane protein